ncbi:MAG: electron transporter RnfD [Spirochaetaceae bacterium]|nr:MAG: electron transporter RnfD [Spirochaetaceae bacterium]
MRGTVMSANPPQFHDRATTGRMMWAIALSLLPAAGWGVYRYGTPALFIIMVAVGAAVISEGVIGLIRRRPTLRDGSAVLVGLLIGMAMPPWVGLHVPATAAIFAMLVVKWSFGGLGGNWMNAAAGGLVFAFYSWNRQMIGPGVDGESSATVLATVRGALETASGPVGGPVGLLRAVGYPVSSVDASVTDWLNARVLTVVGANLPGGYVDLFLGYVDGAIGEGAVALLLIGTIALVATRVIRWEIPAAYFASYAIVTRVFGGLVFGDGYMAGDVLFHTLSGGVVFAMFYLAPDLSSAPTNRTGMLVYGAGAGALTFLFRFYGAYPGSGAFAVLVMNTVVPLLNRGLRPRRFGTRRRRDPGGRVRAIAGAGRKP